MAACFIQRRWYTSLKHPSSHFADIICEMATWHQKITCNCNVITEANIAPLFLWRFLEQAGITPLFFEWQFPAVGSSRIKLTEAQRYCNLNRVSFIIIVDLVRKLQFLQLLRTSFLPFSNLNPLWTPHRTTFNINYRHWVTFYEIEAKRPYSFYISLTLQ